MSRHGWRRIPYNPVQAFVLCLAFVVGVMALLSIPLLILM